MSKEKAPIYKSTCSKAPKTRKYAITDMREKPTNLFLLYETGAHFSSGNNFANLDG